MKKGGCRDDIRPLLDTCQSLLHVRRIARHDGSDGDLQLVGRNRHAIRNWLAYFACDLEHLLG